jgi:hypothetical protein
MRKAIIALLLFVGIASLAAAAILYTQGWRWDDYPCNDPDTVCEDFHIILAEGLTPTASPTPKRVISDSAGTVLDLLPKEQKWDDRCAILVLRESYRANAESETMCGWTEKPTRP